MFALVDCNNFYASCERIFRPDLEGKPVVVLSNNDGNVIARSQEAKDLGIKMGAPAFLMKEFIKAHNVNVFSSNYALYGDISARVMNTLTENSPGVEVYSIDESFIDLRGVQLDNLIDWATNLRFKVKRQTRIPISIGIAPTKTLAKLANKIAKKKKDIGVYLIDTEEERESALLGFPIDDVWGIGGQYNKLLQSMNVKNAYDFTQLPEQWVYKRMTITGYRMQRELKGLPCHEMNAQREKKKAICTSRSFGNMTDNLLVIEEAAANYASKTSEKLRKQLSCAMVVTVFLETNPFRAELPQQYKNVSMKLPVPSNDTTVIVNAVLKVLRTIYEPGYKYKKVGVLVTGLIPEDQVQTNLFVQPNLEKLHAVSKVFDKLNLKFGKDSVRLAVQGTDDKKWKLRQEMLSPNYTTKWTDLPKVKVL